MTTTPTRPTQGTTPWPRTITKRRDAMAQAKRRLAAATNLLAADDAVRTEGRVRALLWAEAFIQQALALETRDRLGNRHATLLTVRRQYDGRP